MGMMFPLLFYYQENVIFVLLGQLSVLTNYVNALGEGGTDDGVSVTMCVCPHACVA